MFTRNWYKMLNIVMGYSIGTGQTFTNVDGENKAYSASAIGTYGQALRLGNSSDDVMPPTMRFMRTAYNKGGVVIGTGTTPPTMDDYKLSGDLITGYSYSAAFSVADDDNGRTLTSVLTITNNNADAITIGEIGLLANHYSNNSSSSSYLALVERTVLESPITIEPGGVGQVTYTIHMNYPTV